MKPSIYRISLDVHDAHSGVCLDMKQRDTARQIDITLTDAGFPYQISEECYAVFAATKADGKRIRHNCNIRNNIIQYIVRTQTTAAVGPMECEIKLYGAGDKLLMSPGFSILVSENAVTNDEELESEDEVDDLTKLISEATTVITEGKNINSRSEKLIEEMETEKETLEDKAAEAKGAAENAQSMAESAGKFASDAEKAAHLAQKYSTRPDLSQNNPDEPGYIKNRTHWVESSETVIAWDGNVMGTRTYTDALGKIYYKISDKCPEESDVVGATIEFSDGKILTVSTKMFNGYTEGHAAVGGYIYLRKTPVVYLGNMFDPHDVGVYAAIINDVYPAVFRYGKNVVHTLDEKFIPDTIARKTDIPAGSGSGQNVELDATLTVAGKAADAAATGARLTALEQQGGITIIEPAEDDIPKVFFGGDITDMSKENEKVLSIAYRSNTMSFDGFVKMKWQGTSSIHFAKKNYTIKIYDDEATETKKKVNMKGWGEQNKFCLKANYVDITHARNIVSARLWSQIVATRSTADKAAFMTNSPNNGAVDGFPIKLYLNGKYEGLYTWNIPKDAWMFAMDEDNPDHCVLCAEQNNNGNNSLALGSEFRAECALNGGDWSVEVPKTATDGIKTGFNNLVSFVMNATDEEFKANLSNHANVQSLIDYFCFMIASCANDNAAKNMLMATEDGGAHWYACFYDMDSIWGQQLQALAAATSVYPADFQETNSLLWERMIGCFAEEIKARYIELRKSILSIPNVFNQFERFSDPISHTLYEKDRTIYALPGTGWNSIDYIEKWAVSRFAYADEYMATLGEEVNRYTITKNFTNVSSNNAANTIAEGEGYTATITANIGYTLGAVTVTMGGVDITATAASGGVITIEAVTGDLVITASATGTNTKVLNLVGDNFTAYLSDQSATTGAAVADGSFLNNTVYYYIKIVPDTGYVVTDCTCVGGSNNTVGIRTDCAIIAIGSTTSTDVTITVTTESVSAAVADGDLFTLSEPITSSLNTGAKPNSSAGDITLIVDFQLSSAASYGQSLVYAVQTEGKGLSLSYDNNRLCLNMQYGYGINIAKDDLTRHKVAIVFDRTNAKAYIYNGETLANAVSNANETKWLADNEDELILMGSANGTMYHCDLYSRVLTSAQIISKMRSYA